MSFESNKLVTLGQAVELNNEVLGKVANKNYLTEVDSYTLTKQTNPDTGYAATYQLFEGGTAIGDKINIPLDMVVQSGSVVDIVYDGTTPALKEGTTDVTAAIKGVGNQPSPTDEGAYIKLVIANSNSTAIYIKATDLVDTYTNGNGITITNNAIAINVDPSNANGLSVGANGLALAGAVASTSGVGGSAGAMSAADKEKLDNADVSAYTAGNGIDITSHAVSVKANDGIKVTAAGVGVKIASSGANGLSVDSNGVTLATASGAAYVQATGQYYIEGTTYYTDSTGATEVDTTGFTGNTDVSEYYVAKVATSGAMSAADKTKLDGFVVADSTDVTSAIAGLVSL